jgi:hypothetical protein
MLPENTRFHGADHVLEIVLPTRENCYRNVRDFKTGFKMERISGTQIFGQFSKYRNGVTSADNAGRSHCPSFSRMHEIA